MRVSVVIPSYKRPESLRRCLSALGRQQTLPDEILVVARPEDEDTRRATQQCHSQTLRLIPVSVPAGRPGFVAALNAGVDASSGEFVCFTDDDAEPHPDWISRILAVFAQDSSIGAVGGRDWVHHDGRLEDGAEPIVGTVGWWGRVVGNHHLGAGPVRDVAVLKGVNLSVRGALVRQVRFDERLLGVATEHHSELALCLTLRRMGYRIVYDPAIGVDHHPQPRAEGQRALDAPVHVRNATHNETLALLEYLPRWRKPVYLAWAVAVGTSSAPGVAQTVRSLVNAGTARASLLGGALVGRALAVRTHLRSRRRRSSSAASVTDRRAGVRALERDRVLAIGHSASAAQRIRQLLGDAHETAQPPRSWRGMLTAAHLVLRSRARTLYLVDVGMSTTMAATLGRLTRKRVVLDTGDATFALARSLGDRSRVGLASVAIGEQLALRSADHVVVRGRAHAVRIPGPTTHIPDLAPADARPVSASALRAALDIEGAFVVGVVGSLIFSPRRRISYGWDLIEALALTSPQVVALVVGDGSGLGSLQARARALGVSDRCRFVGRVPVESVNEYVSAMEAAISTQTNDLVGRVRTTAKLPLYLACGCPVIATHVGEAAALLGPLGWTLPYHGVVDLSYPARLAEMIEAWRLDSDGIASRRQMAVRLAEEAFDPETMRARLADILCSK